MATRFPGIPKEFFPFLLQLKKNNNREWFQARKETFETKLKQPFEELVTELNRELAKVAPDYVTEPKKAIFRIYRDTRFSPDKTPYKTHLGASFNKQVGSSLQKDEFGGFYFHLSPEEIGVAGGIYNPQPENLLRLRTFLADHHEELESLLAAKRVKTLVGTLQGTSLTRPPKGFPKDHPAELWLRRKQFYFWDTSIPLATAMTPKLVGEVAKRFAVMLPVVEFLNRPLAGKRRDPLAHIDPLSQVVDFD